MINNKNISNKFLTIIVGILLFLLFYKRIFPNLTQHHSAVNYAPDGWIKTINASVNGRVTSIDQSGLFSVFVNGIKLSFTYDPYSKSAEWRSHHKGEFIELGDSIFKKQNNDTFYIIRGLQTDMYLLPR
jgi:hypothetical protein